MVTFTLGGNAFGRIIDANGQRIGEAFEIDPSLGATQTAVAALQDGKFVTTWTDSFHGDGDGGRISGQVNELVQNLVGDGEADVIAGGALRDIVRGNGGADVISGGGGADLIRGDADQDAMTGDAGDDVFEVASGDVVAGETYDGGSERDTLHILGGGSSRFDFLQSTVTDVEILAMPAGLTLFTGDQFLQFDTVDFGREGSEAQIVIRLSDATSFDLSGLRIIGSLRANAPELNPVGFFVFGDGSDESITGSSFDDFLEGADGADVLNGLAGADLRSGVGATTPSSSTLSATK